MKPKKKKTKENNSLEYTLLANVTVVHVHWTKYKKEKKEKHQSQPSLHDEN